MSVSATNRLDEKLGSQTFRIHLSFKHDCVSRRVHMRWIVSSWTSLLDWDAKCSGETEVGKLEFTLSIDQQVLRFQVSAYGHKIKCRGEAADSKTELLIV